MVIDEIVGQGAWPFAPSRLAVDRRDFLFRVFDVAEAVADHHLERLPGGWGIMADDVLAGVFTALVLQGIRGIL